MVGYYDVVCNHSHGTPRSLPWRPTWGDRGKAGYYVGPAMMRFYWLKDRAQHGQLNIYWDSGKHNLGDYYTKHHPPTHHKQVRPIYTFIEGVSPETLQGCIDTMNKGTESRREAKGEAPSVAPKGIPKMLSLPLSRVAQRLLSSR